MLADVIATTALATQAGMTYGAYVAKYGVVGNIPPKIKAIKGKICACGADISNKHPCTKYCDICAAEHISKSKAEYKNDIVSRRLMDLKQYQGRLTPQQYKTLRGQVIAGDIQGAKKGLHKIIER